MTAAHFPVPALIVVVAIVVIIVLLLEDPLQSLLLNLASNLHGRHGK